LEFVHPRETTMSRLKKIGESVLIVLAALVVLGLLFVNVGPRFLPYQALVVRSGSMTPTIPTGSLVLYKKATASSLKVGDIIVFTEPNTLDTKVTHRIYAIHSGPQGKYFLTKGDANANPDSWTIPAVGSGWEEFWHAPDIGYVLSDLQGGYVRVILIIIPALLLAGLAIVAFRRGRGGARAPRPAKSGRGRARSPRPSSPEPPRSPVRPTPATTDRDPFEPF
jgi:signal peptidase I